MRFDNAFIRLLKQAEEIGIISKDRILVLKDAIDKISDEIKKLKEIKIAMKEVNDLLKKLNSNQVFSKGISAFDLLKIKEVSYDDLGKLIEINEYEAYIKSQIETIIKYEVFIERENLQIEKFKKLEAILIPKDFDFNEVKGISNIARDGLNEVRPLSIGEASRISGVSGQDIALLIGNINRV